MVPDIRQRAQTQRGEQFGLRGFHRGVLRGCQGDARNSGHRGRAQSFSQLVLALELLAKRITQLLKSAKTRQYRWQYRRGWNRHRNASHLSQVQTGLVAVDISRQKGTSAKRVDHPEVNEL